MAAGYWRARLGADALSHAAFSAALEPVALSVSAFEVSKDGRWRIEALLAEDADRDALRAELGSVAASLKRAAPEISFEPLPDIDWLAENRRSFPPLRVGRYFIRGTHHDGPVPAGAVAIVLDASIAFGSGEHATTRGCLLAIGARAAAPIRQALDLGCGSGILAIALAKSGARRVVAADVDRDSVRLARENLVRNGVASRVRGVVSDGTATLRPRRGYDVVVANILAGPLCRLAGAIVRAASPGATVILSGLLADQDAQVRSAYRARGLVLARRIALDGWLTLVFRKPGVRPRPAGG